jgi:hypothetical protein
MNNKLDKKHKRKQKQKQPKNKKKTASRQSKKKKEIKGGVFSKTPELKQPLLQQQPISLPNPQPSSSIPQPSVSSQNPQPRANPVYSTGLYNPTTKNPPNKNKWNKNTLLELQTPLLNNPHQNPNVNPAGINTIKAQSRCSIL